MLGRTWGDFHGFHVARWLVWNGGTSPLFPSAKAARQTAPRSLESDSMSLVYRSLRDLRRLRCGALCAAVLAASPGLILAEEAAKASSAASPAETKPAATADAKPLATADQTPAKPAAAAVPAPAPATHAEAKPAGPTTKPITAPPVTPTTATPANPPAASFSTNSPDPNAKFTFSFRYQPWQEVLDWFSQQAGLSLLMESPPPGTFNYADSRTYTATEALDVLNGVLLTKGFTLVRHGKMLVVVNLEDGIPPNLVPDVPLEELDQRGEYELIRVLFPVWNMTPEQAAAEIQPLLGPQGKAIVLPQARQVQVTETGGRLRTIRSVINAVEQPERGTAGMREFALKYITFEAAMPTIRQMLGIPAEAFSSPDNSVQITKSATGEKLLVRGTAQQAARLQEVLRLIDIPEAARGINGAPQLEVYSVTTADPEAVVKMLQTMLHDPTIVLTADKDSGRILAFATPPQQATIRATIDQMQKEAKQVDVISLSNVDAQVAVLAINKLFGSQGDQPDPKAPRVDADITTRSLMVRGTSAQVAQIRDLLHKLGETEDESGGMTNRQHVRLLPLSGAAARSAISQIEQIWPSVRQNRIRIVSPSSTNGIPSFRPSETQQNGTGPSAGVETAAPSAAAPADSPDQLQEIWQSLLRERAAKQAAPAEQPAATPDSTKAGDNQTQTSPTLDRAADASHEDEAFSNVFHLVAGATTAAADSTAPTANNTTQRTASPLSKPNTVTGSQPGSPVIVAPGPGGTLIASDDLEALDELEDLLSTVAGHNASSGREFAVYYLKYSKATTVAEVLSAIFGGNTGGKDKGIIGDMASNALGNLGGGLMGDLLLGGGGSGGGFTSGAVDIVPDSRLNALIVHAKSADLDTVEQLLKVLDQRSGPEDVEAEAQPRTIPVYNATASEIATIVQQVFQDRMAGAAGVMSPQDMMKMIRGGSAPDQQIQKMSIAVDARNNALIVRAPDALFEDVKALVTDLDHAVGDSPETTRVVSLKHTNSSAVQKALSSILPNVKATTTGSSTNPPVAPTAVTASNNNDEDSPEERMRRAMRRNFDMMQEMRRMQGEAGGGGDRGGFDRSRFFRGGGPGGPDSGGRGRDGGDRGDRGGRGRD